MQSYVDVILMAGYSLHSKTKKQGEWFCFLPEAEESS